MFQTKHESFKNIALGDCVKAHVPQYDRGRGDLTNINGVVLNIIEGTNKIGIRGGIQQNRLYQNTFEKTHFKGLLQENVLMSNKVYEKKKIGNP